MRGLLRELMDDEGLTPFGCRPRRGLLLRMALFWSCQAAQNRTKQPGMPLLVRPIWLDAR